MQHEPVPPEVVEKVVRKVMAELDKSIFTPDPDDIFLVENLIVQGDKVALDGVSLRQLVIRVMRAAFRSVVCLCECHDATTNEGSAV